MKLVGCLSFFEERPSWLAAAVSSYVEAGVDEMVAVDGAYALFPRARGSSTSEEQDVIREVCKGLGVPLTMYVPSQPWADGEREKRSAMFALAEATTTADDWYVVIDADEIVTRAREGWKDALHTFSVAELTLWERPLQDTPEASSAARSFSWDPTTSQPIRKLFRAERGLRVEKQHYNYVLPDGRRLWGPGSCEPAIDLTEELVVEHRTAFRAKERMDRSKDYYLKRDTLGIER